MRLPLVLTLSAALALPSTAVAKEVTAVSVCGAHACTRLTDHASLDAFMRAGGLAEAAPNEPQRSYVLRVRVDEPGTDHGVTWTSRWLPDAGLMASRGDDGTLLFTKVEPALDSILRRAARGHAARPARRYVRRAPAARVVEVVPPPRSASASATAQRHEVADAGGGPPALAWAGAGALLLLAAGGTVGAVRWRLRAR